MFESGSLTERELSPARMRSEIAALFQVPSSFLCSEVQHSDELYDDYILMLRNLINGAED